MSRDDIRDYPYKIISAIPPGNWGAKFETAHSLMPLVCWAVIEIDDSTTKIVGMIAAEYQQIIPCDFFDAFLCYMPTELPESAV